MKDCIFCKIIAQEIPGHVLYEDNDVLVFLDISQTTKGHTLVIPKVHRKDVFEMEAQEMEKVFSVVPRIARALKATFNCSGINIINNNGEVAGQTVFHYHIHLIPRYLDDRFRVLFVNNMAEYDNNALKALKDQIKRKLED